MEEREREEKEKERGVRGVNEWKAGKGRGGSRRKRVSNLTFNVSSSDASTNKTQQIRLSAILRPSRDSYKTLWQSHHFKSGLRLGSPEEP